MKNLLLFCFYLSFITFGQAQWNKVGLPFGYNYYSSFIDQGGNLFIATKDSIYYSDDNGHSWINTGVFKIFKDIYGLESVVELENHDLLISSSNDVYKFNRKSKTWDIFIKAKYTLRNIDQKGNVWYVPNDPSIVGNILTEDGGNSYQLIEFKDSQLLCSAYHLESYNDSINYMLTSCNGLVLYRFTKDGSVSLLENDNLEPFLYINPKTGTVFILNSFYGISRSTDMGTTFNPVNIPTGNLNISSPYMQQLGNGQLLLRNQNVFFISYDDGENWINFKDKLYPDALSLFNPSSVAFINSSDTVIAISNSCIEQGSYISPDKGKSWEHINNNLRQPNLYNLFEDRNNNIYMNTCIDSTLVVSNDNGSTWNSYLINCNGNKYAIKEFANSLNGEIYAISDNRIFKSYDNGKNFINLELPDLQFSSWSLLALRITNSGNIYLISYPGSLYSNDNGQSWKNINFNNSGEILYGKIGIDNNENLYVFNINNQLIRYNADINNSEILEANKQFEINKFELTKNGNLYIYGYDSIQVGLWVSKDNLKSFEKLSKSPNTIQSIFSDDNSNLYIESADSIFVTSDYGQNFNYFTKRPGSALNYVVTSSSNLYAFKNLHPAIYKFNNKLESRALLNGIVYNDVNKNCALDNQEPGKSIIHVIATGASTGETYSINSGGYSLKLKDGNYNISTVAPNPLWNNCMASNVIIDKNIKDTTSIDLGLQPKEFCPYLTVQVQAPIMRRCFENKLYIRYCNEGTSSSFNTTLHVMLPDKLNYLNSSVPIFSQNGQELVFNLGELSSGECGTIIIYAKLSCDAKQGEMLCTNTSLSPVVKCEQSLVNLSYNLKCTPVTGSIDPNEKTAYINGTPTEGQSEKDQDIEYLIKFQNTGTDTAFRVVIKDKIPEGFDINTLKPLNSSHPYHIEIEDQRTLSFIFDPIALPDSNINEAASHGFIAFMISPKKDLDYGTKLDNFANIYFDYNAAVKTNIAYLTVAKVTSIYNKQDGIKFNYYPNPTRGSLNIHIEGSQDKEFTIRVKDILGKELLKESWVGSDFLMQRFSLIAGLYLLDIEDSSGKHGFGKFNVE